jgi:hypothetical protein
MAHVGWAHHEQFKEERYFTKPLLLVIGIAAASAASGV